MRDTFFSEILTSLRLDFLVYKLEIMSSNINANSGGSQTLKSHKCNGVVTAPKAGGHLDEERKNERERMSPTLEIGKLPYFFESLFSCVENEINNVHFLFKEVIYTK